MLFGSRLLRMSGVITQIVTGDDLVFQSRPPELVGS